MRRTRQCLINRQGYMTFAQLRLILLTRELKIFSMIAIEQKPIQVQLRRFRASIAFATDAYCH